MRARVVIGVVCGALAAALGALILGEYEFNGTLPFVAGPLFGLVIAEVVVSVSGRGGRLQAGVCGALSAGGLLWAGWIDANEGVEPIKPLVWVAMLLGAAAAILRAGDVRLAELLRPRRDG